MRRLLFISVCFAHFLHPTSISYTLNGGRLGDCLINYIKCRFLAYKYGLNFLHTPFPLSKQFVFFITEKQYLPNKFSNIQSISDEQDLPNVMKCKPDTLIMSNYYTQLTSLENPAVSDYRGSTDRLFDYVLQNSQFLDLIRSNLRPRITPPSFSVPLNVITVALHVRKGGGFDQPLYSIQRWNNSKSLAKIAPNLPHKRFYGDIDFPTKFPPDQYYIDQLKAIAQVFDTQPLYIFMFTDDPNPEELVKKYKKAVNKKNITFACRSHDNHHTKHVVEDLICMAYNFDILIRSSSSFAWVAQLIGEHKLIITPIQGRWHSRHLVMDRIEAAFIDREQKKIIRHYYAQETSINLAEFIQRTYKKSIN